MRRRLLILSVLLAASGFLVGCHYYLAQRLIFSR